MSVDGVHVGRVSVDGVRVGRVSVDGVRVGGGPELPVTGPPDLADVAERT